MRRLTFPHPARFVLEQIQHGTGSAWDRTWALGFTSEDEHYAVEILHHGAMERDPPLKITMWDLGDRIEVITPEVLRHRIQDASDHGQEYPVGSVIVVDPADYEAIVTEVRKRWAALCYVVQMQSLI